MKSLTLLPLLLLMTLCLETEGQRRYLFSEYNTSDGLADNNILTINQDGNGYIYFGTDVGITRYDGYDFNNDVIPIISDNAAFVECIARTPDGKMVVASFMQGFFIQQDDGSFRQYLISKPQIGKNVIKSLKVISENKILISTGIEIYLFENDTIKPVMCQKTNQPVVTSMEYDKRGNIWFSGYKGVAVISSGDTTMTPYFLPDMEDKYVYNLLFDPHGDLLAGTINGFYRITFDDPDDYRKGCSVTEPFPELKNTTVNHIYCDNSQNIWISTTASGVFIISNNEVSCNLTSENGLPAQGVLRTFQDREGNYWFATNSGAVKLSDFNKYSFSYGGVLFNKASGMTRDKYGRYITCNSSDFYIIKNDTVYRMRSPGSVTSTGGIKRFVVDDNTLWLCNYNALFSLELGEEMPDPAAIKTRASFSGDEISRIRCMNMDNEGSIWIASDKGIVVFRDNRLYRCIIDDEKASRIRPVKIIKDSYGYYWFGDFSNGLYRMRPGRSDTNTFMLDSIITYKSLKPDSSFVTAWVQDMILDHEGNLWYSSLNTGVYRLKIDNKGVTDYMLFSPKNGLSSNQVTKIREDDRNRLWFASLRGADCYDPAGKSFMRFNKKNALGNQVLNIATDSSRIFLEYNEGIMVVEDINKEMAEVTSIPVTIITKILVDGFRDSLALSHHGERKYKFSQNSITFEYGAVTFRSDNLLQYRYRLHGLNTEWSTVTGNRNISYGNLPPGHYCFMVRTVAADGRESNEDASYAFTIIPPFYRTWWFMTLAITLLLSSGYLLHRYRVRQLLKMERLRTRIASDLHDDIGSTLSSISILSDILYKQPDQNPVSAGMIEKIGTNARSMLDSMDDIIWAVNPSNDRFRNLDLRVREYAIPLFEAKDIIFSIVTDENLNLIPLPMDVRRNIYLVAKEAINNLLKYSECEKASVEFCQQGSCLVMTVTDNGRGFDVRSPSSRNGLKNMEKRAGQINADIVVTSLPGEGTTVRLTVKII